VPSAHERVEAHVDSVIHGGRASPFFALLVVACSKLSVAPQLDEGERVPTSASSSVGEPSSARSEGIPLSPSRVVAQIAGCGGGRKMRIHFYDVGQGLAALVDLPDGRHILVDTGDSPSRAACGDACVTAGRRLIDRLYADLHGSPIDLLWITHPHSDHIGGAPEILSSFHVETYVDNGRDARRLEVSRARDAAREHGAQLRVVDPDHAEVLLPHSEMLRIAPVLPRAWPRSCAHDANECSIALRIDFCASSALFTGDAEHDEEAMLDLRGPVTLLQVAHHGSDTSTTPGFLAKIRPSYAVISAGRPKEGLNVDYCHPRALVVKRLTSLLGGPGSKTLTAFDGERCASARASDWVDVPSSDRLFATERDGDVVLSTSGDGVFVRE
jgi:competence protein ComEC